jgi:hypothetical protein
MFDGVTHCQLRYQTDHKTAVECRIKKGILWPDILRNNYDVKVRSVQVVPTPNVCGLLMITKDGANV